MTRIRFNRRSAAITLALAVAGGVPVSAWATMHDQPVTHGAIWCMYLSPDGKCKSYPYGNVPVGGTVGDPGLSPWRIDPAQPIPPGER